MLILQQDISGKGSLMVFAALIGYLLVILVFSLLNTAILRFAADVVIKKMPRFKTAFFISFFSLLILVISDSVVRWHQATDVSVLNRNSFQEMNDSALIAAFPLLLFLLVSWIFNSKYLTDSNLKIIGFGQGAIITALEFLFVIGIVILILSLDRFTGV